MESRQERIRLLSRVNRENAVSPMFLEELSKALGVRIDTNRLVDTSGVDELMIASQRGYAGITKRDELGYRRFFRPNERARVLHLAGCLADRLGIEEVFFLTKFEEDLRAVKLCGSELFKRANAIIDFDGDSLSVLSEDRSQGILIDYNPDDYEQAYEIAIWGDRWKMLVPASE
jgi:hypothetical protein